MARRRNQRDTTKFQDVFDWIIVGQLTWTKSNISITLTEFAAEMGKNAAGTLDAWFKTKNTAEGVWGGKSDY